MSDVNGVPATSRRRFVGQVALATFAGLPALKTLLWPQAAAADQLCQTTVCEDRGDGSCCSNHRLGRIYRCYDHLDLQYQCWTVCVLNGGSC